MLACSGAASSANTPALGESGGCPAPGLPDRRDRSTQRHPGALTGLQQHRSVLSVLASHSPLLTFWPGVVPRRSEYAVAANPWLAFEASDLMRHRDVMAHVICRRAGPICRSTCTFQTLTELRAFPAEGLDPSSPAFAPSSTAAASPSDPVTSPPIPVTTAAVPSEPAAPPAPAAALEVPPAAGLVPPAEPPAAPAAAPQEPVQAPAVGPCTCQLHGEGCPITLHVVCLAFFCR